MTAPNTETPTSTPVLPALSARASQPRPGFWVVLNGLLGVIAQLGKYGQVTVPTQVIDTVDGVVKTVDVVKDVLDTMSPHATVQLVNTKNGGMLRATDDHSAELGEGVVLTEHGDLRNVPLDALQPAPWSLVTQVGTVKNNGDWPHTALNGYRMGYPLNETETAQATDLYTAEQAKAQQDAQLATHPDWQESEKQLATELEEFRQQQEAKRKAVADKILAPQAD